MELLICALEQTFKVFLFVLASLSITSNIFLHVFLYYKLDYFIIIKHCYLNIFTIMQFLNS